MSVRAALYEWLEAMGIDTPGIKDTDIQYSDSNVPKRLIVEMFDGKKFYSKDPQILRLGELHKYRNVPASYALAQMPREQLLNRLFGLSLAYESFSGRFEDLTNSVRALPNSGIAKLIDQIEKKYGVDQYDEGQDFKLFAATMVFIEKEKRKIRTRSRIEREHYMDDKERKFVSRKSVSTDDLLDQLARLKSKNAKPSFYY